MPGKDNVMMDYVSRCFAVQPAPAEMTLEEVESKARETCDKVYAALSRESKEMPGEARQYTVGDGVLWHAWQEAK